MTKLYASCAAMVVVQIGYGGSNILMKIASEKDLNPFVFVVYRHFIAFLLLAPFAYVIDRNKPASLTIPTAIKIFLLAILGSTIHLNLFYVGIGYTSPTVASAFSNVIPSLTFVMAVLFRLEKVNIRTARGAAKVLGTILCIGGSLIFTLWKGPYVTKAIFKEPLIDIYKNHGAGNSSGKDWIKGSAFILISDIAWSVWLILQAFVTRKYPAQLTMTVLICLFATAQSGFLALIFARDPEKWKLQWDARLLTIVYSVFKVRLLGRVFHTLIKNDSFSSPNRCGISQSTLSRPSVLTDNRSLLQSMWDSSIHSLLGLSVFPSTPSRVHPLQGSAFSLAHRPVSSSCTICNASSSPLTDIVLFGLIMRSHIGCEEERNILYKGTETSP